MAGFGKYNITFCDTPGGDSGGKVNAVEAFLKSPDRVLVCTHATFRHSRTLGAPTGSIPVQGRLGQLAKSWT